MTSSRRFVFFLTVTIAAAFSLPAHAVLIDNFTDASSVSASPGPSVSFVSTLDVAPLGSIVGGERVSLAGNVTGGGSVDVFTKIGTSISAPVMAYGSAPGVAGVMELLYDDSGFGLGGGLGEDFTAGGDNAFNVGVNFADFPAMLTIEVSDIDGDSDASGPHPMPGLITGGAPVAVTVPYASFSNPLMNFDKVTSIKFIFEASTPATDLEILFLESTLVVPEPATLAGFSLMGLLALARRRRS